MRFAVTLDGPSPAEVTVSASVDRRRGGRRRSGTLTFARRGVADDRGIRHRRQPGRAGRNVHACAGRPARRDGRPRIGAGHDPGRRRDDKPRAVDRRCGSGRGRGRSIVRGDAGRPERGGSDGGLCDGGPGGVRGSCRRGGHRLRERVGDADVRARRGVADDRGIRHRRQPGRAGRNVHACAGRPARRDGRPRIGAGHDPGRRRDDKPRAVDRRCGSGRGRGRSIGSR